MFENQELTNDEDFMEMAMIIAFPRKRKMFLERPNHFTKWRDKQFFNRFRLPKKCVYFMLNYIKEHISSSTRYSIQVYMLNSTRKYNEIILSV